MSRRPSGRAALAASATLFALVLVTVSGCGGGDDSGEATGPAAFYGVAPEGQLNPTDYSRMAAGGVGTVRVVLQWSGVETAKGAYDWSAFDQLLNDVAGAGLEPIVTVFGTPQVYAETATIPPTDDARTFDAWADFLRAAAARYGNGGDYWESFTAANPEAAPRPVREWEIWNEPNSSTFWSPTPDPAAYAKLVKRSARILGKADGQAQVMTAGMFATPQSDGAIVSYDFLADVLGRNGIERAVDLVGLHPYGPNVEAVTEQVAQTRKTVDEAGSDAHLWVTEVGWGSDPKPGSDLSKTPEEQADLLSESFKTLYDSREKWGLDGVVWYTWHDSVESTVGACGWCASAGLVDADRDSKPAWIAFTDLTGGTP